MKTRVVEIVPDPEGKNPHTEVVLGFADLPVPPLNAPTPRPADGSMPPPILVLVNGQRYFVIGYSYDIVVGEEDSPPTADYVLIVQAVPKPSSILRVGADAMEQVRAMIPEPGKPN